MRYAFAGDRQIAVNLLGYLIAKGYKPLALLVASENKESHAAELIDKAQLDDNIVFEGKDFTSEENLATLQALNLDYIIGIHFPYIISERVLSMPNIGVLNLHPSYLPYNKGWHTPSWAILENQPYGATLHFMSKALDEGDIIHQKRIELKSSDTANTLYARVLKLEEEIFKEALPELVSLSPKSTKQLSKGTSHNRKDLEKIRELKLDEDMNVGSLIDRLRALTTNNSKEASFFKKDGKKYSIQVNIEEIE